MVQQCTLQQQMNRDVVQGNKIIYQKMYRRQRMRQLQRLQQIRSRSNSQRPPQLVPSRGTLDSDKHLEIERNNIALFNKIASIIKEKPKVEAPRSRLFVKSLDQAMFKQERKMEELKAKNEDLLKRISKQQPTIRNENIRRDRMRHEGYLSFIGRYPFKPNRRSQTQFQLHTEEREEVFHQKTLDFEISIIHQPETDQYVFKVRDLAESREYVLSMEGKTFKEELASCELNYQAMVGKLRMAKTGAMTYNTEQAPLSLAGED